MKKKHLPIDRAPRPLRKRILLTVLAGLFLFAAPSSAFSQEHQSFEIFIPKNFYKFDPDKLTVHTGDTVKWVNTDDRIHKLVSVGVSGPNDELELFSDELHPGKTYLHQFKDPGEYPYYCFIHNKMVGSVTVLGKDK